MVSGLIHDSKQHWRHQGSTVCAIRRPIYFLKIIYYRSRTVKLRKSTWHHFIVNFVWWQIFLVLLQIGLMISQNANKSQISTGQFESCQSLGLSPPFPLHPVSLTSLVLSISRVLAWTYTILYCVFITLHTGADLGVAGVLAPWKYVGGSEYVLTPIKCHILSFKSAVV